MNPLELIVVVPIDTPVSRLMASRFQWINSGLAEVTHEDTTNAVGTGAVPE